MRNGLFHLIRISSIDDSVICLPWDKNLARHPQGQTVVYGKFTKIYKRVRRYPSMSVPPGTDTENHLYHGGTLVKWNSRDRERQREPNQVLRV